MHLRFAIMCCSRHTRCNEVYIVHFKQQCIVSFCLHDYIQSAVDQPHQLQELASIADCNAECTPVIAQSKP